jgi:predicted nucleic acid-binding protein
VKDEIMARTDRPGAAELEAAMRSGWIRVAPTPLDTWAYPELDAGEASTIALALQTERAVVLMDDTRGCEQAAALGLRTIGIAGVLLAAKRAGLVDAVGPLLERLARRGFTLPDDVLRSTLAEAGEQARPG